MLHTNGTVHAFLKDQVAERHSLEHFVGVAHVSYPAAIQAAQAAKTYAADAQVRRESDTDKEEKDTHEVERLRISTVVQLGKRELVVQAETLDYVLDQRNYGASKDAQDNVDDVWCVSCQGQQKDAVDEDEEHQGEREELQQPRLVQLACWRADIESCDDLQQDEADNDSDNLHLNVEPDSHHCFSIHHERLGSTLDSGQYLTNFALFLDLL